MIRELFLRDFSLSSCVWQSTIFIMVGLVVSFILRHRSSRAHQVLFLAMIAAVIVPIMSILVKHYELGMFVAEPVVIQSPAEDLATASNYGASGVISAENIEHNPGLIEEDLPSAFAGLEGAEFPWRSVVLCGWIVASLILAARLLVTFVLGVRILGRALPIEREKIEQALHLARAKLGIDKDVKVRSSQSIRSPVIWCWRRRPVLLVPSTAGRLDNRVDWAGVLCHELAHWKRRDHISGLFAELVVCIFPWHPLLWWAKSRLISLSEQACDDWVVATGRPSTDYAESLLDLTPGGQMAFVPAVVRSRKGLASRVQRILQDNCGNPRTGALWALTVSIVATSLALGVACAQTRPAKTEATTAREGKPTKSLHQAARDGEIEQVKLLISKGADVNEKRGLGTPLHYASEKGHTEVAKLLIRQGAHVNATGWREQKPLHCAAMRGDKQTVELLLSKGADVNAKNRDGRTPLFEAMKSSAEGHKELVELLASKGAKVAAFHLAAYMGDMEKLKKFLQKGININTIADCNFTALHAAANSGKKDIVEFLISKGADVNAKDTRGLTPLYYAAIHNYEDIVDVLLAKGADVNAKGKDSYDYYTLLYFAIWDHNKDAIKLLISKGANVNAKDDYDYTPLFYASWENDKDTIELLISKGADVNAEDKDGRTPYYWAAMEGRKNMVEFLTAKGATPVSSIHLAARAGDLAKVKRLIEEGTNINAKDKAGKTPFFWAVFADNNDVSKFLITKGADVNAKDSIGMTPLFFVIFRYGKKDMVELLISKGADVNAKDKTGMTPLHPACFRGLKDVAELLIAKGANVNAEIPGGSPVGGMTPLLFAAKHGHKDVAELLIAKGADINAREDNSRTPLHEACLFGHKDVVELMIAKGADMNAKDNMQRTVLSSAKQQGHDEIAELLRKHGAKE